MKTPIEYFLNNSKLNYTILFFLIFMGISSYIKIPKELVPLTELDQISIKGSYSGSSASTLDGFVVSEIESNLDSLSDVDRVVSVIKDGSFNITLELQDGANVEEILDDVKDILSSSTRSLPSDMNTPVAKIVKRSRVLYSFSLFGDDEHALMELAKQIKYDLSRIEFINSVTIVPEQDREVIIELENEKLVAYGVSPTEVITIIKKLNYIYPVGQIDDGANKLYLKSNDNKLDTSYWASLMIELGGKRLYLSDIASISVEYPKKEIIARTNNKTSLAIRVYKNEEGNSMDISKNIQQYLHENIDSKPEFGMELSRDASKPVSDRLDSVISNITFGILLVGMAMYFLISPRISIVVALGIPLSFIIGIIVLYYQGTTITMISMLAILITIGIIVDDAIIISENIQRYIDEGEPINDAVLRGTKEMIMPVVIASMTTIFAFIPMLYLTGRIGMFISIIPIVVSILIFASLIESFLFLPLHAKHILKKGEKSFDWSFIYNIYEWVIHHLIHFKKTFLITFVVIVPILTYLMIENSKFQFFPRIDGDDFEVTAKFADTMTLEETDKIAREFEAEIKSHQDEYSIQSYRVFIGEYQNISNQKERIDNGFSMVVELKDFRDDNWIQNYLKPIFTFSFDFEMADKVRLEKSFEIIKKARVVLTPLAKKYKAVEFNVMGRRIGVVKTDIEIKVNAKEKSKVVDALQTLKAELKKIKGVVDISDNAGLGYNEYSFTINNYGLTLGLNESDLATTVASFYRIKEQSRVVSTDGLLSVTTQSISKDSLNSLEDFNITLKDGRFVKLKDVVDFKISKDFNAIEKEDGMILKKVYANVDFVNITPSEVIEALHETIEKLKSKGVVISFGGEKEQNAQLEDELSKAVLISVFLIFITLLINFPSFKIVFIIISVIPFSILGALIGHLIMGLNLSMPSLIGMLGLAGVVINDGIIMLDFLQRSTNLDEFYTKAKQRVRPILITSITTLLGLATLILYPSGQGVVLQPLAVSLGFGLIWGTLLNLFYLPVLYALMFRLKPQSV